MSTLGAAFTAAAACGLAQAQTTCVTSITLTQVFYLFNCRSLKQTAFAIGFFTNRWVLAGSPATWSYETTVKLVRTEEGWAVDLRPAAHGEEEVAAGKTGFSPVLVQGGDDARPVPGDGPGGRAPARGRDPDPRRRRATDRSWQPAADTPRRCGQAGWWTCLDAFDGSSVTLRLPQNTELGQESEKNTLGAQAAAREVSRQAMEPLLAVSVFDLLAR